MSLNNFAIQCMYVTMHYVSLQKQMVNAFLGVWQGGWDSGIPLALAVFLRDKEERVGLAPIPKVGCTALCDSRRSRPQGSSDEATSTAQKSFKVAPVNRKHITAMSTRSLCFHLKYWVKLLKVGYREHDIRPSSVNLNKPIQCTEICWTNTWQSRIFSYSAMC